MLILCGTDESCTSLRQTQSRVSNWTLQTSRHVPSNPFVPTEADPELRSDFYANTSNSSSEHSVTSSGTARPALKRSHTAPHRDTSRRQDTSSSNTRSRSSAKTTTTSTATTATTATVKPTRQRPSRSQTTDSCSNSTATTTTTAGRPQPIRSKTMPSPLAHEYDIHHGDKHITVPASKHGYTYVVIPRHGAPIKVVVSYYMFLFP
jgi:hypothetical protein